MNAQVLTTTTSASQGPAAAVIPSATKVPANLSESTWFFGQPSVSTQKVWLGTERIYSSPFVAEPVWDLELFLTVPRVAGLALSPDGCRLVTSVAAVAPDRKSFTTSLWALDTDGAGPPRRLTRSAPGESGAAFLPDGSLLFTSTRPDPDAAANADDGDRDRRPAGLWLLPADGGEARLVVADPGGVQAVAVARTTGTVAFAADRFPGTTDTAGDEAREKARTDAGVTAQLFDGYPVRYWDTWLGPRQRRLFAAAPPLGDGRLAEVRDLTPEPGRHLDQTTFDITPDGSAVVTGWRPGTGVDRQVVDLVAIDTASGERRTLLAAEAEHSGARCAPNGRWVVCRRGWPGAPDRPADVTLWLVDLATGEDRELTPGLDLWPHGLAWAPDSAAVYFVADEGGRAPVFRVELGGRRVTRLSGAGAFGDLCPSADGSRLFALCSTPASPPAAVALDPTAGHQAPRRLPTPGADASVPGRLEEVVATADDGVAVRSWLVLPDGASPEAPAPLVVFVHGGPLLSWNSWHWRWNPQLLAERGYAVLLPDPALSTGYGLSFIARGWGRWGDRPYTDVLAAVDAAVDRPDVDATRTALLGGSFGGYMANWVAGHTDRFRAIVTHASLWALDQFHGTTDVGVWWERQLGDPDTDRERYEANSPHRHVAAISTPMLVVHGDRDHRVPVGEALRLWTDLRRHGVEARFLSFPDENHWVTKPQNVRLWYETVLAFLDHHVLGQDWRPPDLL